LRNRLATAERTLADLRAAMAPPPAAAQSPDPVEAPASEHAA
jgi:hypothetical protein